MNRKVSKEQPKEGSPRKLQIKKETVKHWDPKGLQVVKGGRAENIMKSLLTI